MTTRFLFSSISAMLFAGETTLDEIHQEWATEACELFEKGFDDARFEHFVGLAMSFVYRFRLGLNLLEFKPASLCCCSTKVGNGLKLHLVCVGGKGDWKYLRKATCLEIKVS